MLSFIHLSVWDLAVRWQGSGTGAWVPALLQSASHLRRIFLVARRGWRCSVLPKNHTHAARSSHSKSHTTAAYRTCPVRTCVCAPAFFRVQLCVDGRGAKLHKCSKPLRIGPEVSWSLNKCIVGGREKAVTRDTTMGMLRQWEELATDCWGSLRTGFVEKMTWGIRSSSFVWKPLQSRASCLKCSKYIKTVARTTQTMCNKKNLFKTVCTAKGSASGSDPYICIHTSPDYTPLEWTGCVCAA